MRGIDRWVCFPLLILCLFTFGCSSAKDSSENPDLPEKTTAGPGPMKKENIIIFNATNETVFYSVKPINTLEAAVDRNVAVNDMDYISCLEGLELTFRSRDIVIRRELRCGNDYTFVYDDDGVLDLKEGRAPGVEGEDLAPYAGTPIPVIEAMLEMAEVDSRDILYDLGSGDGRIVITAAKKYGCRGVGIEYNPGLVREAEENALKSGVEDLVEFRREDVMRSDFAEATVVTIYLFTESNARLRPRLEGGLTPGTLVVCHNYPIPGWEQKEIGRRVLTLADNGIHTVILYRR